MEQTVKSYLEGIKVGEKQTYRNVAIFPLFSETDGSPRYHTLKEALAGGYLTIGEVSEGGHVPELKVTNSAAIAVLILDGEELAGAKQNRIVNTTILLRAHSETIIPVSCTEQGRWSYASAHLHESGNIATSKLRHINKQNVMASLHSTGQFRSDQGAVWDNIHEDLSKLNVEAPTGAMQDGYAAREKDLDDYLGQFPYLPGQKGMLVLVNSEVAGMDIVSLETAYAGLHPKLVKSYAMEALMSNGKAKHSALGGTAKAFIVQALACNGKRFKSVGHGWDLRFEGKTIVGSALVYNKKVIHAAFFRTTEAEKVGYMSGVKRRRGFRN